MMGFCIIKFLDRYFCRIIGGCCGAYILGIGGNGDDSMDMMLDVGADGYERCLPT